MAILACNSILKPDLESSEGTENDCIVSAEDPISSLHCPRSPESQCTLCRPCGGQWRPGGRQNFKNSYLIYNHSCANKKLAPQKEHTKAIVSSFQIIFTLCGPVSVGDPRCAYVQYLWPLFWKSGFTIFVVIDTA
jgi:hypothetical protein